jgi:hypothetical protein
LKLLEALLIPMKAFETLSNPFEASEPSASQQNGKLKYSKDFFPENYSEFSNIFVPTPIRYFNYQQKLD